MKGTDPIIVITETYYRAGDSIELEDNNLFYSRRMKRGLATVSFSGLLGVQSTRTTAW